MNLPWNKNSSSDTLDSTQSETSAEDNATETSLPKGYTPKKGKATPKRNDIERAQGVRRNYYSAPATGKEARQERKKLKNSMSKEEYKVAKKRDRERASAARKEANEKMMSGEEDYLPNVDKGPEKRFLRDYMDSHRYLMGISFIIVILTMVATVALGSQPVLLNSITLFFLVLIFIILIESFLASRRGYKAMKERFPDSTLSYFNVWWYFIRRAILPRRMRTPRPQVSPGKNTEAS